MGSANTNKILSRVVSIFMCGDVMTGRGIDQVLPHPCDPRIHEPYVRDARRYLELAEETNGPIPNGVNFTYIWGDALDILKRMAPDVRIINLETSITTSGEYWKGKGINYRMHPQNVPSLSEAGIDVCVLANNHVLDWGYEGLAETLQILIKAGIKSVGAGSNLAEAETPAVVRVAGKGRVVVFNFGSESSGIPRSWAAGAHSPGVNLLPDLSDKTARAVEARVLEVKQRGDIVVASIHWGGNWGYAVPGEEVKFAHALIDRAGVDVVHGHSSHHPQGIEIYHGKPVIYGCGDFINDYEGIRGYDEFRGELGLMYFVRMDPATGSLVDLRMKPTRMRRFRVNRASATETLWLCDMLNREGERFDTAVEMEDETTLLLCWQ